MVAQETREVYWFRPERPYVQCEVLVFLSPERSYWGYKWPGEEEKPPSPKFYTQRAFVSWGALSSWSPGCE